MVIIMTGFAIVVYLNQKPMEPRERDYAYAASFFAFAICIGWGVIAIYEQLRKYVDLKIAAIVSTAACMIVPIIKCRCFLILKFGDCFFHQCRG